jgi:Protein of unknown function (DUF4232)
MGLWVSSQPGRALGVAALLCTALLAAACSSGSSTAPPSPAASPSAPAATSAPATSPAASPPATPSAVAAGCASSGLTAKVDTAQSGAAAGSVYVPINFTNTTGRTCTLFGYPGVSFVTSPSGSELGRAATRVPPAATTVTLGPGGVAHAVIRVAEAGNYSPSDCVPVTAHWLRIYPPNQFTAIYARYTVQACSARLPHTLGSQLSVYVMQPGPGKAGEAP